MTQLFESTMIADARNELLVRRLHDCMYNETMHNTDNPISKLVNQLVDDIEEDFGKLGRTDAFNAGVDVVLTQMLNTFKDEPEIVVIWFREIFKRRIPLNLPNIPSWTCFYERFGKHITEASLRKCHT